MTATPTSGLQLRSLVQADGQLRLSLEATPVPDLRATDVLVRIEATPINPSDIGLLFGAADPSSFEVSGTAASPVAIGRIPERAMPAMAARLGQSMAVGNEGAGVVIAAGDAPAAQALLGKTVAVLGGSMYAQYRVVAAAQCLLLPEGTTPTQGASCFVNPLTALGMTETMRREGHTALVHTAAASNLGQMLNKICQKDGIALVNIVRKPEQEALLRGIGASYVCNMTSPTFMADLTDALAATGATIAFDATGGGTLAGQILAAMEAAINRSFGMAWGVGGWLLTPFLQQIGSAAAQLLRQRVASELATTFASHYARELSLAEALSAEAIAFYGARNTGSKVLINPAKGL